MNLEQTAKELQMLEHRRQFETSGVLEKSAESRILVFYYFFFR